MAGSGTGYSTNITAYGEGIFIKVRWFVVIKATNGSCTCLSVNARYPWWQRLQYIRPIQTYSGRGVSKNVVKHHHAIIYTGNREPKPRHDEQPTSPRERGMLDSIRVIPTRQGESMDPMSRINFKKVYTVEYNVKVRDFGNVDKAFLRYLKRQFDQVWNEDWFSSQARSLRKWRRLKIIIRFSRVSSWISCYQMTGYEVWNNHWITGHWTKMRSRMFCTMFLIIKSTYSLKLN